jgi:hypothetical protein
MSHEHILSLFTLAVSAIGICIIWYQLEQSANATKSTLLVQINRDLNSYSDIAILLDSAEPGELVGKLSALERERLLDYISYFEGLYLCYARGLFSLSEVNDYFAGRFFRIAHNAAIQTELLTNETRYGDIFRPIFQLHAALNLYRDKNGHAKLYPDTPLSAVSSDLYQRLANQRWFQLLN